MLKIANNPIDYVLAAAGESYPELKNLSMLIQFNPELLGSDYEMCGCTSIFESEDDEDTEDIVIDISPYIPLEGIVDVLAHELSHVVAHVVYPEVEDEHGEEFDIIFESIHAKYIELMTAACPDDAAVEIVALSGEEIIGDKLH